MKAEDLQCWKCGATLVGLVLPLARRDECPACAAELHVCKLCEFHDPSVSRGCREPVADEVRNWERANFCGYFQPRPGAHTPRASAGARRAQAEAAALFGLGGADNPPEGPSEAPSEEKSEAELARERLERLFGGGEGGNR